MWSQGEASLLGLQTERLVGEKIPPTPRTGTRQINPWGELLPS